MEEGSTLGHNKVLAVVFYIDVLVFWCIFRFGLAVRILLANCCVKAISRSERVNNVVKLIEN